MNDTLESRSRDMQERTFCKWLNTKLEANGYPPMASLVRDLSDGVRDVSLGRRYNKTPRMRIQKAENVNKALEFITSRGVKLTNIGPEDIIDGNVKLILGMIWTLILRFTIADISEEGLSAKEGLLLWCQRKTEPYNDVDVQDFSLSWSDGLALCALIHCHRPDLIDYDKLDKSDRHGNTRLAFDVALEHLNIPQLLEVEDLCDSTRPDERSVMTYIASYFHAFSSMDQAETVSRRVEKFAELMQSVWISQNDYERRVRLLLAALTEVQAEWSAAVFTGSYSHAKDTSNAFRTYKQTQKRTWVIERQDYSPPLGLALTDLDDAWKQLLASEAQRSRSINAEIRQIKERLRKKFADLANAFEQRLSSISSELSTIHGALESQQDQVREIQKRLPQLTEALSAVSSAEEACTAANVEENDYTISFIDNQIVSRNHTNLTPAQLEQFESTFRLGIVYSDEDMDYIYDQLTQDYGAITFEAFINLLVDIMEDQTTPDQLRESFRGIASDKPFVTELDLRMAQLTPATIEFLKGVMQSDSNEAGEPTYDYERWIDDSFLSPDEVSFVA
ncbi:actinin-like protein [Flagelloscypha sp. PMI_526]|nr:actinin-like protein [Flagelloscypha sp. PMI_526]